MIDVTLCEGIGCVVKHKCRRFKITVNFAEYYFDPSPYVIRDGVFCCDMFLSVSDKTHGVSVMLDSDS